MINYYKIFKPFKIILNLNKSDGLEGKIESGASYEKEVRKKFFFKDECGQRYCINLRPVIKNYDKEMVLEESLVLEKILKNDSREEIGILCLVKKDSESYSISDFGIKELFKVIGRGCLLYYLSYDNMEKDILGPFSIKEVLERVNYNFSRF
jgi:hypothetical protein